MSSFQREFATFLLVGVVATASHYALLIVLVEFFAFGAVIASAAGAFLGALVSYLLNRRLTFRSTRDHHAAAPRFFAIAGLSLLFNTLLMALFTGPLTMNYILAQAITTAVLIVLTYGANKFWTFGKD